MSIKSVEIENGLVHNEFKINFSKGHIASIIGLNGHGKSMALDTLTTSQSTSYINSGHLSKNLLFSIDNKKKVEFKSFPLFSSKKFNLDFISIFDANNWNNSLNNLSSEIAKNIISIIKLTSKALHIEGKFTELLDEIKLNSKNKTPIWNYMISLLRNSNELVSLASDSDLVTTIQLMYKWHNDMSSIIKTRKIDQSLNTFTNFRLSFKAEGGIDLASLIEGNGTWFVRFINFLKLKEEFSEVSKKMLDEKRDVALQSLAVNINKQISAKLNQPSLVVNVEFRKASTNSYNVTFAFVEGEKAISFASLSKGTRSYLSIISQLGSTDENWLITIDEPDEGLHPSMQLMLREQLEAVASETGCKIVISTHSIYMLNKLNNRVNTYVSWKSTDGQFNLKNITDYHNKNENIAQSKIWETLGYTEFINDTSYINSKKIIMVEGDTDKLYFKKIIEIKNKIKKYKNVVFYPSTGADKIPFLIDYLIEVKGIDKNNIFSIFDGDQKGSKTLQKMDEKSYKYTVIPFKEIENIFEENDKQKFTYMGKNDKFQKKLIKAIEFVNNTQKLSLKTNRNIDKVFAKIEAMF